MKLSAFVKLAKREIAKHDGNQHKPVKFYVYDGTGPKPPPTFLRGADKPIPDGVLVVRLSP